PPPLGAFLAPPPARTCVTPEEEGDAVAVKRRHQPGTLEKGEGREVGAESLRPVPDHLLLQTSGADPANAAGKLFNGPDRLGTVLSTDHICNLGVHPRPVPLEIGRRVAVLL